jgi:hypothetical protein
MLLESIFPVGFYLAFNLKSVVLEDSRVLYTYLPGKNMFTTPVLPADNSSIHSSFTKFGA